MSTTSTTPAPAPQDSGASIDLQGLSLENRELSEQTPSEFSILAQEEAAANRDIQDLYAQLDLLKNKLSSIRARKATKDEGSTILEAPRPRGLGGSSLLANMERGAALQKRQRSRRERKQKAQLFQNKDERARAHKLALGELKRQDYLLRRREKWANALDDISMELGERGARLGREKRVPKTAEETEEVQKSSGAGMTRNGKSFYPTKCAPYLSDELGRKKLIQIPMGEGVDLLTDDWDRLAYLNEEMAAVLGVGRSAGAPRYTKSYEETYGELEKNSTDFLQDLFKLEDSIIEGETSRHSDVCECNLCMEVATPGAFYNRFKLVKV